MDQKNHLPQLVVTWTVALLTLAGAEISSRLWGPPELLNNLEHLLDYQQHKVPRITDGALIFVGDSSLGSAIDARALSARLDKPVFNFALVGSASTIGDYYLVREALAQGKKLSGIVIMHTSDLWTRRIDQDTVRAVEYRFAPFGLESVSLRLARTLSLVRQSKAYKKLFLAQEKGISYEPQVFAKSLNRQAEIAEGLSAVDYVPQGKAPNWVKKRARGISGKLRIDRSLEQWFDRTVALGNAAGVPVYVTISPLWSRVVRRSAAYNRELANWLNYKSETKRFTLLFDRALPMPAPFVGDSEDHVRPEMKRQYTEWFAEKFINHNGSPLPLEPTPFEVSENSLKQKP
jgi:hypothetical protein